MTTGHNEQCRYAVLAMTEIPPRADRSVVHLVRHGEVANPQGVLYGRIPGFHLSEDGRLMAKAAADFLAGRDVTVLMSSPLERAIETAEPLAAQFGLTAVIDDRLIEPWNHFEGMTFGIGDGALRRPGTGAIWSTRCALPGASRTGRSRRECSMRSARRPVRRAATRPSASAISCPSG